MDKEKFKIHYQHLKDIEDEYYQKEAENARLKGNDRRFAERGLEYIKQRCAMYIRNHQEIYDILNSQSSDIADRTFKMDEFSSAFFSSDLAALLEQIKGLLDNEDTSQRPRFNFDE